MAKSPAFLLAFAFLAFFLTGVNRFIGLVATLPERHSPAAHAISIVYLLAVLATLIGLARAAAHLKRSTGFLLATGIALAAPMLTVLVIQSIVAGPGPSPVPLWLEVSANNLFGPIGAVLVGAAIGRIINHPNTLLAAAGFAAFFDFVVVFLGPVAHLLESRSPIIQAVSVGAGGAVGATSPFGKPIPVLSNVTIGPADVLFLAVFLSSVVLLSRKEPFLLPTERRTVLWLFGLLALALTAVEFGVAAVPALAPMGLAIIGANYRHGAFTKQEKRDLVIGAVFAVACAGLIIFFASRAARNAPKNNRPRYGFVPGRVQPTNELLIKMVFPNSPALEGGLHAGDVVESLDGERTGKMSDEQIMEQIQSSVPRGLRLRVRRLGEKKPLDLLLQAD